MPNRRASAVLLGLVLLAACGRDAPAGPAARVSAPPSGAAPAAATMRPATIGMGRGTLSPSSRPSAVALPRAGNPAGHAANMADLLGWVAQGKLSAHVDTVYSLDRTPEALQVIARREAKGKILVRP